MKSTIKTETRSKGVKPKQKVPEADILRPISFQNGPDQYDRDIVLQNRGRFCSRLVINESYTYMVRSFNDFPKLIADVELLFHCTDEVGIDMVREVYAANLLKRWDLECSASLWLFADFIAGKQIGAVIMSGNKVKSQFVAMLHGFKWVANVDMKYERDRAHWALAFHLMAQSLYTMVVNFNFLVDNDIVAEADEDDRAISVRDACESFSNSYSGYSYEQGEWKILSIWVQNDVEKSLKLYHKIQKSDTISVIADKLEEADLALFKSNEVNKFLLKMRKYAHTVQIFTTLRTRLTMGACPSIDLLNNGETSVNYNEEEEIEQPTLQDENQIEAITK